MTAPRFRHLRIRGASHCRVPCGSGSHGLRLDRCRGQPRVGRRRQEEMSIRCGKPRGRFEGARLGLRLVPSHILTGEARLSCNVLME